MRAILDMLLAYMPWLLPEYSALRQLPELGIQDDVYELTIEHATDLSELLEARLGNIEITHNDDWPLLALARGLREYLPAAGQNLRDLAAALRAIAQDAERLADETQFRFLAHPERQVLSLGYHVRTEELNDACYDLMASEARIATFLAIARDDLPLQSWIKLGRSHTRAFGSFLLLSWTGTMFEYLMPALWMRSYPNTLISRTLDACVGVQRAFANSLNIPWGISESGYSRTDDAGHYQYRAFGLPQVALSIEATAGPVVSPYSTFLALGIDSVAAIRNLRRMAKAGWVGAYGFYEAADFSAAEGKPVLVREWMAHHQGMALLAILNLLRDNAMQRWFHANPLVQATELLLQEMPMGRSMLKASIED